MKNDKNNLMQAVGIYGLAGYLWEGRVPYYQDQVEIKRMVLSMGIELFIVRIQEKNCKTFNHHRSSEWTFP